MRQGLKDRIQFKPSDPPRMSVFKTDYLTRQSFNDRVANAGCAPNGECSNARDISGFYVGTHQQEQLKVRQYYAPFRQPVKGYRKTLYCMDTNGVKDFPKNRRNCLTTTEIYKDTYTDCSGSSCINNGSISTSTIPLTGSEFATKSSSGNYTRTSRPIIRSGMQPNIAGKQNSGLPGISTATRYSYSYRELINNRRKDTQMKKLATEKPTVTNYMSNPQKVAGYGGGPCVDSCNPSQTTYRYNNSKFATQGAVESSDRITRLKLDTIRAQSNCPPGTQTGPANERSDCNGPIRPGHTAAAGTNTWPPIDPEKMGCKSQVKYTYLFNKNHHEVNYPQVNALTRARGSSGNKRLTTGRIIDGGGNACPKGCSPQLLM